MTSTSFSCGLTGDKLSSRVLKPPGGGHTDIFGGEEKNVPHRPEYNQQNSSNMNAIMGTQDPNSVDVPKKQLDSKEEPVKTNANETAMNKNDSETGNKKVRVPPGGFSSGPLW